MSDLKDPVSNMILIRVTTYSSFQIVVVSVKLVLTRNFSVNRYENGGFGWVRGESAHTELRETRSELHQPVVFSFVMTTISVSSEGSSSSTHNILPNRGHFSGWLDLEKKVVNTNSSIRSRLGSLRILVG